VNNIPEEEFNKRFTELRCVKLSKCFGKPAETYTQFVEENFNMRYKDLVDLLCEKGIEKREDMK